MPHDCKFEERIIEMSGDVKSLVTEFRSMNGTLKKAIEDFETHESDSVPYRRKIDVLWTATAVLGWAIPILLGTGVIVKWLQ